ncbi:hypothetical protein IFM89_004689 [Coptis chinensis]|uniref:DOG1 domain-containing protein n=1 Tax=Coptis chinensis TaxID=261450 RepID=A0A835GXI6_9MAGN|nr:hypothetical protein IFM89_004689 [Coptis chinensis]
MVQQEEDLTQLVQGMSQDFNKDEKLRLLVETSIKHFEEYHKKRLAYARSNASSFFSPSWCSSFENSYLWIAGCRPSLYIRLVHTLCGSNIESQLGEFLQGVRKGKLSELSAEQLGLIEDLQRRTVRNEDNLSTEMASMQEEMADNILVQMTSKYGQETAEFSDREVNGILDSQELAWSNILEKADLLRLNTLKEIVNILRILQAVEFLIAGIDIESQLDEFLQGVRKGNLGELSAAQLGLVNDLQLNTIRDEDKMSSRMATMQEEMGHKTLVQMASELTQYCESNSDLHQALDSHEVALVSILEGADKLRLNTMKELVHILTTTQTVEFLLAGKKLQLSIHECCKTRTH